MIIRTRLLTTVTIALATLITALLLVITPTPAQAAVVSRDCYTETRYNSGTVCLEVGRTGSVVDGLRICNTPKQFLGDGMRGIYNTVVTVRSGGLILYSRSLGFVGNGCTTLNTNIRTLHGNATLSGTIDTTQARPDVAFVINSPF